MEGLEKYTEMVKDACEAKCDEVKMIVTEITETGYVEKDKVIGFIGGVVRVLQQGMDLIRDIPEDDYKEIMKMLSEECCSAAINYVPEATQEETVDL